MCTLTAVSLERQVHLKALIQVYSYIEFESDDDSWLIFWSIESTGNSNGVAIKFAIWRFIGTQKSIKQRTLLMSSWQEGLSAKSHSSSALINHEKYVETLR